MRTQVLISMALAAIVANGCQSPQPNDEAGSQELKVEEEVEIPSSLEITATTGKSVVIYGQRSRDCDSLTPPPFSMVLEEAITNMPLHGTLSNGGISKRRSIKCGKVVPLRAVSYTSDPGFSGKDLVGFWWTDRVIITVVSLTVF